MYNYYVMVPTEESTSVMDAVRSSSKTMSSKLASAKSPVVTEPGKYMLLTLIILRPWIYCCVCMANYSAYNY